MLVTVEPARTAKVDVVFRFTDDCPALCDDDEELEEDVDVEELVDELVCELLVKELDDEVLELELMLVRDERDERLLELDRHLYWFKPGRNVLRLCCIMMCRALCAATYPG